MSTAHAVTYPVADLHGDLVWASDLAEAGERPDDLQCVGCDGRLLLRAGQVNRPHFAHRDDEACSAGETVLHRTACRVVAEGLERASRRRIGYPADLWCPLCRAGRPADLALREGLSTTIDTALADGIRPDVLVSGVSGPLYVVEVVVTHAPEQPALQVFTERRLPVLAVRPTWETLESLREGLGGHSLAPGSTEAGTYEWLGRCPLPRHAPAGPAACSQCAAEAVHVTAETATIPCWGNRCGGADVCVLDLYVTDEHGRHLVAASVPDITLPNWLIRRTGARLSMRYSKQAGGRYLMHQCNTCGAPQGDHFLYGTMGAAATTDTSRPVHHATVCKAGHWTDVGSRSWPDGSVAERPRTATSGLCGKGPGLFGLHQQQARPAGSVSIQRVGKPGGMSVHDAIRRMTGIDRM